MAAWQILSHHSTWRRIYFHPQLVFVESLRVLQRPIVSFTDVFSCTEGIERKAWNPRVYEYFWYITSSASAAEVDILNTTYGHMKRAATWERVANTKEFAQRLREFARNAAFIGASPSQNFPGDPDERRFVGTDECFGHGEPSAEVERPLSCYYDAIHNHRYSQ
jgi:hypothetical protein